MFSFFSDGLQQRESLADLDSESEHHTNATGVIEDIRQLLSDLIDDVIQDTGSENGCTRKPLKRRATDVPLSSSEPNRKRPFCTVTRRSVFNPVAEHHAWCPYVSDIACDGANDVAHDAAHKPWLRLLRQLVPDLQAAITQVQTSPVPDGIARIRRLFRTWTSSA